MGAGIAANAGIVAIMKLVVGEFVRADVHPDHFFGPCRKWGKFDFVVFGVQADHRC